MKKILIVIIIIFLTSCTIENDESIVTLSDNLIVQALTFSDNEMGQYGQVLTIYNRRIYNYGQYSSSFNIEHIYPESLLINIKEKKDLYNLRFATITINDQRANLSFVDNDDEGSFGLFGNGFYPGDDDKGDVARALMYMAHTYNLDLTKMIDVKVALKWHKEDPVDDFERHRADVIKSIQGNENPFIEDPGYAREIYGSNRTVFFIILGALAVGYIGYKIKK